jgi:hypothetical protein
VEKVTESTWFWQLLFLAALLLGAVAVATQGQANKEMFGPPGSCAGATGAMADACAGGASEDPGIAP